MKTSALFAALAVVALLTVGLFVQKAEAKPAATTQVFDNPVVFKGAGGVTFAGSLAFASTIDFASTYDGTVISSAITVTGAAVGDSCHLGMPAAAAALKAKFYCRVTAADEVKVFFEPNDVSAGTASLVSGSPSTQTATVTASSICTATALGTTAAIAAAGLAWSVTTTTATFTGPNTVTTAFAYRCMAPVDPASSSFEGYVTHN